MRKTIEELRNKWLPILQIRQSISDEELKNYNKDVEIFLREHPNWQDNIIYI
jgi:hypothetical protein